MLLPRPLATLWLGSAAILVFLLACSTAPMTGRKQLLLLSSDEEAQLGATAFTDVMQKSRVSADASWKRRVEEIGRRIVAAIEPGSGVENLEWEFQVIADAQVNAFALPGGKVAFYEGILPICATDDGVAVVMGHEVAHVYLRHGNERVSQNMAAQGGLQAAQVIGSMVGTEQNAAIREAVMAGIGLGVQYGVLLPFSRTHESEADAVGLILMARAGYDPREAVRFWSRMNEKSGGGGTSEWMSTHPSHETRIRDLEAKLPEALAIYEQVRRR